MARIENSLVCEILTADPFPPFAPALVWVDCSAVVGIAEGWTYDGKTFTAPVIPTPTAAQQIATIQAQIDDLDGGKQARQVRAMILAIGGGDPVSLAKLHDLEAQIVPLRAQIAALSAPVVS